MTKEMEGIVNKEIGLKKKSGSSREILIIINMIANAWD